MKLYDSGRAPNPRRTRIFLAEKGINVPAEQVDMMAMQHKTPEYTAINPLQRMPALVPRRRHRHHRVDRDLPLFRGGSAGAAAIRRGGEGDCAGGDVEQALRAQSALWGSAHLSALASAMKELEVPQVPAWSEANNRASLIS